MNVTLPEQVERFRCDVAALSAGDVRFGLAVSGGADSLALLLLAHAAFPERIAAATVDHRLRPESAAEAAFVARMCAERGVPHAILNADEAIRGNLQAGARALRYRLLGRWAARERLGPILTGHHADDQAETLLMRLNRGAGLSGLAGIRAATGIDGVAVARPLLGWRRAELAEIVRSAGIAPVEDPANADPRFDRARLRAALAKADWLDPVALARSAGALAEAQAAIDWATERLVEERLEPVDGAVTLDPAQVPAELRRRLLLHILAMLAPSGPPRGEAVQRLSPRSKPADRDPRRGQSPGRSDLALSTGAARARREARAAWLLARSSASRRLCHGASPSRRGELSGLPTSPSHPVPADRNPGFAAHLLPPRPDLASLRARLSGHARPARRFFAASRASTAPAPRRSPAGARAIRLGKGAGPPLIPSAPAAIRHDRPVAIARRSRPR